MIKILVLYVGIIVEIQEHAYDHCRRNVSGHVYIYPNPLGHILKSFASLESEFGIRSKERGDSKIGLGKSQNASIISRLVSEGSKTLPLIYRRYQNKIRSNKFIY
jgi:hypothetical protein